MFTLLFDNNKALFGALLCCIVLILFGCSKVDKPQPTVLKVIDGDTLLVEFPVENPQQQAQKISQSVNLMFIDAPEREQPGGREAKLALTELLDKPNVKWQLNADNTQVVLLQGKQELNLLLVEKGLAWASPNLGNSEKSKQYKDAELNAKHNLSGLWRLGHGKMVPPWVWRKQATEQVMPQYSRQIQQLQKHQQALRRQQQMLQQRQASKLKQQALQQKQREQQGENP